MSNFFRDSALIGATTFALLSGGAAQALEPVGGELQPPPENSAITGVTVEVPKVIERTRYGLLVSEATISVRVPYGDLDMKTAAGVAELDARVSRAGDYVCRQLEIIYPAGYPEVTSCARTAIQGARPQVIKARADG